MYLRIGANGPMGPHGPPDFSRSPAHPPNSQWNQWAHVMWPQGGPRGPWAPTLFFRFIIIWRCNVKQENKNTRISLKTFEEMLKTQCGIEVYISCGNPGSGPWILPFLYYSGDPRSVNLTQLSFMLRSAAGWTVIWTTQKPNEDMTYNHDCTHGS